MTSLPTAIPKDTTAEHSPDFIAKGRSVRHFRALMRKNAINWKRTPFGSLLEILCPLMLMFLIVWARQEIDPTTIGDYDLLLLKKPYYPVSTLRNGEWSSDLTTFSQ